MDIAKLFHACRVGDIDTVRKLIETKDIDLNIRDKWDSSPLYYACLCGHTELVRFLLSNGSRCDPTTFDGERCVFGALTTDIRKILINDYKVISKKVIHRRDYDEFLRLALENPEYSDVTFIVRGISFKVHRCILAARCEYFHQMFQGKWNSRKVIQIKCSLVNPTAFRILLHYLYTGILEFPINLKLDLRRLFRQCRLYSTFDMVENHCNKILEKTKSKFKAMHTNIQIECPISKDYYHLYRSSLPQEIQAQDHENQLTDKPTCTRSLNSMTNYCDIIFKIQNSYFYCHKIFFCGRSDFFRSLLADYFSESNETIDGKRVFFLLDISIPIFDALASYIYTNFTLLSVLNAFELLMHSDVYLLNSLKKFCANTLGSYISEVNVIDLIKLSRMLNLPKLESTAVEYIANNLEQFIDNQHFHDLVVSDAQNVKERQETDTIDIIDDMRYFLNSSSKKDINLKLESIDNLLKMLDLEA
ncbi:Ankyrin repeat and BTB/POZ domain-containing protein 1 [Blomia tropicalis]|nr:Ankyrin repeat and BTB/POZ domain-containing protein 1 [Blomia tropicalis]